jgi:hypothetical protein
MRFNNIKGETLYLSGQTICISPIKVKFDYLGYHIDEEDCLRDPNGELMSDIKFINVEDFVMVGGRHLVITCVDYYYVVDIDLRKIGLVKRNKDLNIIKNGQIFDASIRPIRQSRTDKDKKVVEFIIDGKLYSHRVDPENITGHLWPVYHNPGAIKFELVIQYSINEGLVNSVAIDCKKDIFEELFEVHKPHFTLVNYSDEKRLLFKGHTVTKCKKLVEDFVTQGTNNDAYIFDTSDGKRYVAHHKKIEEI